MIVLTARDLSRQFDVEPVFQNVTFDVTDGEKIGIVGPNGAGKTTLMRLLAGLDDADRGEVIRPTSVKLGFLQQQNAFAPEKTLLEEAREGLAPLYALQHQAAELAEKMAAAADSRALDDLHTQYDAIHTQLQLKDAYHIEHRVDEVLQGLGFSEEEYDRPLRSFSGGQQNRALLARILLEAPDVMLLDEPTNHLDIETTEWLEAFLTSAPSAVIVVSHDRYFLDRISRRTLEIFRGGVADYPGGFSKYWSLREERHEVLRRTYEKQQEYIAKTEDFIRRNFAGQKSAQAKDREKKLERLERVTLPPEFEEIPMGFAEPSRAGDWIVRADGLSKGFPNADTGEVEPLFTDLTLQVDRGDRIGILGPNGSGKTTLIRVLMEDLPADEGTVRQGTGVDIAYFDQQLQSVDPRCDAVEAIRPEKFPDVTPGALRNLLARFGVKGELGLQTVGNMSGGERTKVALAGVAVQKPNVMILDEPTNHLDFWACAALERSLREFEGTVLFVSHDRYFLDQVATKILSLGPPRPEKWFLYEGNYSGFQHFTKTLGSPATQNSKASEPTTATTAVATSAPAAQKPRRKRKFPYRKVDDIEQDIANAESDVARLEEEMADPEIHRNAARMKTIQQEYDAARASLAQLMEHWEEALELN